MKALILSIAAAAVVLSVCSAALRAGDLPPAEEKQIEALIATIERMSEAAFIRNGQPYLIRFSDGRETPCSIFLRTELSNFRKKEQ
jgi:hypothetical protein